MHPSFHPGRTAIIEYSGQSLGIFGEIHPTVTANYEMNELKIVTAELNLDIMLNEVKSDRRYTALPKYPAVKRDIAITADKKISADSILKLIRELAGDLLFEAELFDVYEGTQITEGYRSLAYSLSYRATDRTLRDDEVNQIHLKVTEGLKNKLGAKLRQ
jgi:phenylalanyl-tRNA synthetase beta chain